MFGMEKNVTVLATGLDFPEGPVVMDDGSIVLVEISGPRLSRVTPVSYTHLTLPTNREV